MLGLEKWFTQKPIGKWTVLDDCNAPMPCLDGGPWIIGGAALEFMQTRDFVNCRDIDYFFKSYSQFSKYLTKFRKIKGAKYDDGWDSHYTNKNYNVKIGEYTFNLIGFGYAANAEIVSDSFDFTVCQVWTDGKIYECSDQTLHDIRNKVLSFTDTLRRAEVVRNTEKTNAVFDIADQTSLEHLEERIRKYRDKGYEPDEHMIGFILKHL